MNKRKIAYILVTIALLIFLENALDLTTVPKQFLKQALLGVGPLIGIYVFRKSNLKKEIKFERPGWKDIKISLIAGIIIFIGTVGGYFLLQFMFEAEQTVEGLRKIGVTPENIIIWGLYLSFINSLLEEFFFRGYVFYELEKKSYTLAIVGSSMLFSIYHVVLMILFFPWYTVLFTMVGLFLVGAFLAYMNRYGKSFINSWIIHIFADLGCVAVGMYMFTLV